MGTSNSLNINMDNSLSFLAPLMELAKDEEVKDKVLEVAKTFFSSSTVTVNVLPAIALAAVSVFLAVGIVGLVAPDLIPGGLPRAGSSSNVANYRAPSTPAAGYGGGSPTSEYVEPESEYATPSADPSPSYDSEYRSANGFNEFRSLLTNVLDGSSRLSEEQFTSKMEQMAGPMVAELTNT